MAKPSESRRWHQGLPRSCYSAEGIPKRSYETAAQAASVCKSNKYPYKCPSCPYWHLATYKRRKK